MTVVKQQTEEGVEFLVSLAAGNKNSEHKQALLTLPKFL